MAEATPLAHVCSVKMAEAIGFHWAAKPGMFSSGTEYMLEGAVQHILNMFRVNCEVKKQPGSPHQRF